MKKPISWVVIFISLFTWHRFGLVVLTTPEPQNDACTSEAYSKPCPTLKCRTGVPKITCQCRFKRRAPQNTEQPRFYESSIAETALAPSHEEASPSLRPIVSVRPFLANGLRAPPFPAFAR